MSTGGDTKALVPFVSVNACIYTLLVASSITTCIRLYARVFVLRAIGLDDVLAFASLVLIIVYSTYHSLSLSVMYEVSTQAAIVDQVTRVSRRGFIYCVIYNISMPLIDLSIIVFYLRFISNKRQRVFIYVVAGCIIAMNTCCIILLFIRIEPFAAIWHPVTHPINRIRVDFNTIITLNMAAQVTFRVILLCIPLPILLRLKTNKRVKVGLMAIYTVGLISLSMTLIRFIQAQTFSRVDMFTRRLVSPTQVLICMGEIHAAIISANMPGAASVFYKLLLIRKEPAYLRRPSDRSYMPNGSSTRKKSEVSDSPVAGSVKRPFGLTTRWLWSSLPTWRSNALNESAIENLGILRHTEICVDSEAGLDTEEVEHVRLQSMLPVWLREYRS